MSFVSLNASIFTPILEKLKLHSSQPFRASFQFYRMVKKETCPKMTALRELDMTLIKWQHTSLYMEQISSIKDEPQLHIVPL